MANGDMRGRGRSVGTERLARLFRNYLVETVLISAVFYLVIFGLLVLTELSAPTPELVFIGLVPFLVLLVASGQIAELRFGDVSMKFQRAVQAAISPDAGRELIEVEPEEPATKGGPGALERMIETRGTTLVFQLGRAYSFAMIETYLRENLANNPEFRYVLFTDESGRFRGLMDAADFVTYVWRLWDEDDADVVDAIRTGRVLEAASVVRARITDGSTLGEARRKLQAADADQLVVVDHDDRFVGVLTREAVVTTLLERVTGRQGG